MPRDRTSLAFVRRALTQACLALALACIFAAPSLGQGMRRQPEINVTSFSKPAECGDGSGLAIEKGYVRSYEEGAVVTVMICMQRTDGVWEKRYFEATGSGSILFEFQECGFTGNFYAFARYKGDTDPHTEFPSAETIRKKHESMGNRPRFRVLHREKVSGCPGGKGVLFLDGQVFTPKGEAVNLTLFLEKKNGGWRKAHFRYVGSGILYLGVEGCDLTGNYKSRIVFAE